MTFYERLEETVNRVGWDVILIPEDEEGAAFAFTVGLHKTFAHPEVLMMGLQLETLHQALNVIGDLVKNGNRFIDEAQSTEILENCACVFRSIHRVHFSEYLGTALGFYKLESFEALQCFWPDDKGLFPGQRGFDISLLSSQRQLFDEHL